jgi:hypothetical protein
VPGRLHRYLAAGARPFATEGRQFRKRELRALSAAGLFAALLTAVLFATPAGADREAVFPGTWCGGTLWRQMAFSDADRGRVDLQPQPTTIAEIGDLEPPARIGLARSTNFQRHVWSLHAVIDRYRIASNGEIVLILFSIDAGKYMNAYLPNPLCLGPRSRARAQIVAARDALKSRCPLAVPAWRLIGVTVDVEGVGFWNPARNTRGALPNGAELRPLTKLAIVSGCGVG